MLTGYYQKNKERSQKRLVKGIKIFLKKKKNKSVNMLVKVIKGLFEYRKNYSRIQKNN